MAVNKLGRLCKEIEIIILIHQIFWSVTLRLQVAGSPVTIYQLPAPIDVDSVPAVIDWAAGYRGARPVVHALSPSRQCHAV